MANHSMAYHLTKPNKGIMALLLRLGMKFSLWGWRYGSHARGGGGIAEVRGLGNNRVTSVNNKPVDCNDDGGN